MPKDNDAHVSLIMCELTAIFIDWQHMLNGFLGSHSLKHEDIICRFINMFLSLAGSVYSGYETSNAHMGNLMGYLLYLPTLKKLGLPIPMCFSMQIFRVVNHTG